MKIGINHTNDKKRRPGDVGLLFTIGIFANLQNTLY